MHGPGKLGAMRDWDDWRYFLAVTREGSLSAAARRLDVAQPTVGRRLEALEKRLGTKLLVPTPSGQRLTDTGQRLLAHVEQMDVDALALERIAAGTDAGIAGHVRITAAEWVVDSVLAPLLPALLAAHPGLELELVAEARHLNLLRREADVAIRASRFREKSVVQRRLAAVAFALYASNEYLLRRGFPDFSRQCAGHELVTTSAALKTVPDLDWLPHFAGNARVVASTNGRAAMAALAVAGVGLACLPRFLGDRAPTLRRLETPRPAPERHLWLGMPSDARRIPRLQATVAFLAEGFRRLQPALEPGGPRA